MLVCPLMTANIRGVNPDVVGRVKSFRPCNKINVKVVDIFSDKTYVCIETEGSEKLKIASPASNMQQAGTSW